MSSLPLRYLSIVLGTVFWDAGAVLQKRAVEKLPPSRPRISSLARSAPWMAGLLVTGVGWGFFVFGLDAVSVSAARTITGGSYVVLALFTIIFLKTPLRTVEWLAVVMVTVGIFLLGISETPGAAPLPVPDAHSLWLRMSLGVGCMVFLSLGLLRAQGFVSMQPRFPLRPFLFFAALSGLLSSIGDLMMKALLFAAGGALGGPGFPWLIAGTSAALIFFYLAGFYMLSRAYQGGTMLGAIVVSDFFARIGAIFLGAVVFSDPLAGPGTAGFARAAGFLLVLGGSLLLGRFSGATVRAGAD
jgi:multidrug transporter EmrE-like cation transporter